MFYERQILEILERQRQTLDELRCLNHKIERIERRLEPQLITSTVANVFSGVSIMANNALVFNVGQTSTDVVTPLLTDGVTPSNGVVSNLAVTFNDPSATAVIQNAHSMLFTGVAVSTGAISGSTTCTVTDTDGVVSTWTIPFTVTTNASAPPPAQLTQSVVNAFTTPTP